MKKGAEQNKTQRKRKIEGLSIFDSEIAAPSDYGDFMRVDAPVVARSSNALPSPAPLTPPVWEQFMDREIVPSPSKSAVDLELGTNQVQAEGKVGNTETRYEVGTESIQPSIPSKSGYKPGTDLEGKETPSNQVQTGYKITPESEALKLGTNQVQDVAPTEVKFFESKENYVQTGYNTKAHDPLPPVGAPALNESTRYKVGTVLGANWVQTEHKLGTASTNNDPKGKQASPKVGTQVGTVLSTERVQTGYKKTFASLRGVQRQIVLFLFEASLQSRGKTTGPVSIEHLALSCQTNVNTAKVSIKRLCHEELISKAEFANGRGGWTKYSLSDSLYNDILQDGKLGTVQAQTEYKLGTYLGTQPGTSASSSSSSLIKENLKTNTEQDLPADWDAIDFSFLSVDPIRFGRSDLVMLYKLNLFKAADVQRALREFHFDITHNKKSYGRGALFGVLRKGNLWVAQGYEPEEEKALREQVRALEARHQKTQELRDRLEELQFQEWVSGLTLDQKKALSPFSQNEHSPLFITALRNHYNKRDIEKSPSNLTHEEVRSILDQQLGPFNETKLSDKEEMSF